MMPFSIRSGAFFLSIMSVLIYFSTLSASAADGRKWDGGKYPFRLLDPSKANSESNPFIIDTAGKLAYFADLAKCEVDMEAFGKKNGLKGLHHAFKDNYVKLTADLDMNGSQYEFKTITGSAVNFDGGGHVITNLRISDKTSPPYINPDTGDAEITLGLFASVETLKNLGIGKGSSVTYYGVSKLTLMVYAAALSVHAYKIDNCFSEAAITIKGNGETLVGGITNTCGYLTNSVNRGPIVFEGDVIVSRAKNRGFRITSGWLKLGGVCASADKTLQGCSNSGSIAVRASGDDLRIGGVAGDTNNSVCADLMNTGNISVSATGDIKQAAIGGVLGQNVPYPRNPKVKTEGYIDSGYICNRGNIDVSILTGKTIAVGGVGGGLFNSDISMTSYEFTGAFGFINAWNTGSVSAAASGKAEISVGGIAGSGVLVFNCYNAGGISGSSAAGGQLNIGGIGGCVYVQNSCNYGAVRGKGAGTNYVGGVIGLATIRWGEVNNEWYTAHNAFWLKSSSAGGINSDVAYAKGSYYYKKQGDIKKEGLGKLLDSAKKRDTDKMVENDGAGYVYSFDTPSSSVMMRSDDGPGKRPNLSGTLLDNLNTMVEDKLERLYRRWIIDGSNGGYPVLSSKPTVYSRTFSKPDAATASLIAGSYKAVHRKWQDTVVIGADGSFRRATGSDGGTWSFDGKRLTLKWTKWTPEVLSKTDDGSFSCSAYSFTLSRTDSSAKPASNPQPPASSGSTAAAPAADTQLSALEKRIVGAYYAQHKDWTDALILKDDRTFKREKSGDSGTWTFDGRKLVLTWSKTGTVDTLVTSATGFACLAYKFTLRR